MRTFIAVEIPSEIRKKVGNYTATLKGIFPDAVKWVLPENLHFTIKFLGEISESNLRIIEECVSMTSSDHGSFRVSLSGIGFFPSQNRPRVLWLGTDGGGDKLLEVYQYLEHCLEHEGFDRDAKTFSPHLTIGRVKKHKKLIIPEKFPDFRGIFGEFDVSGLVVMKSTLTPSGPIYEKIFESELKRNMMINKP